MKKILLLSALISLPALGQILFPQVSNLGSSALVSISNTSTFSYNCSGPVYLRLENGEQESHHYFEFVMSFRFTSTYIHPRTRGARISFVNHSIFCNRI